MCFYECIVKVSKPEEEDLKPFLQGAFELLTACHRKRSQAPVKPLHCFEIMYCYEIIDNASAIMWHIRSRAVMWLPLNYVNAMNCPTLLWMLWEETVWHCYEMLWWFLLKTLLYVTISMMLWHFYELCRDFYEMFEISMKCCEISMKCWWDFYEMWPFLWNVVRFLWNVSYEMLWDFYDTCCGFLWNVVRSSMTNVRFLSCCVDFYEMLQISEWNVVRFLWNDWWDLWNVVRFLWNVVRFLWNLRFLWNWISMKYCPKISMKCHDETYGKPACEISMTNVVRFHEMWDFYDHVVRFLICCEKPTHVVRLKCCEIVYDVVRFLWNVVRFLWNVVRFLWNVCDMAMKCCDISMKCLRFLWNVVILPWNMTSRTRDETTCRKISELGFIWRIVW